MGTRAQQRDPIGGVLAREVGYQAFGHLGKALRDEGGLRLLGGRPAHEVTEVLCRAAEFASARREILGRGVAGGLAVTAQAAENSVNQRYRLIGVLQHQLLEQPVAAAPERLSQPRLDDLLEDEVGLVTVHHHGARIDAGLDRIGFDEALTEAVDRRAGQLVDVRLGSGETTLLSLRQPMGQGDANRRRDVSGSELVGELAYPDEQLARGELGERDRGDRPRRDAFGEHQGDASRPGWRSCPSPHPPRPGRSDRGPPGRCAGRRHRRAVGARRPSWRLPDSSGLPEALSSGAAFALAPGGERIGRQRKGEVVVRPAGVRAEHCGAGSQVVSSGA